MTIYDSHVMIVIGPVTVIVQPEATKKTFLGKTIATRDPWRAAGNVATRPSLYLEKFP